MKILLEKLESRFWVETLLNPYEGLKLAVQLALGFCPFVETLLNPYEGLKPQEECRQRHYPKC